MIGHLGSKVSALVDGRLSPEEEDRAWEHVHTCHLCRDLVEREGWVKTQLATLRPAPCAVSDGFKSSLLAAASLPPTVSDHEPGFLHRHRGALVLGSSAAGVAFVGMAALSGVFSPALVNDRRPTMTNIEQPVTRGTSPATPVSVPSAPVPSAAVSSAAASGASTPSGPVSLAATPSRAVRPVAARESTAP